MNCSEAQRGTAPFPCAQALVGEGIYCLPLVCCTGSKSGTSSGLKVHSWGVAVRVKGENQAQTIRAGAVLVCYLNLGDSCQEWYKLQQRVRNSVAVAGYPTQQVVGWG